MRGQILSDVSSFSPFAHEAGLNRKVVPRLGTSSYARYPGRLVSVLEGVMKFSPICCAAVAPVLDATPGQ